MAEFQIYSSLGARSKRSPQRQSRQASPSHFDVDFYRRKSDRLQEQLLSLSDELNKARLRLRRAQDFQIKYDLLFKQKSALEENAIRRDKQLFELRSKNEEMNLKLMERGARSEQRDYQMEKLMKEIEVWKDKTVQAEERCRLTVAEQQDRASEKIEKELLIMKRNFEEAQKDYKFQISRLRKDLHEKQTVDTGVYERQDKIKKEKEQEISRLEIVIERHREDYLSMTDEKNREIIREKDKFQQILNQGLGSLQKNMNNQDQKFKLELEGLRKMIELKNQEINNLQNQLNISLQASTKEREELNNEIQLLKQKIYERERVNEEELFNMKERLTTLHAIDIEAFQKHYEDLIESLKDERRYLQGLMQEKDSKLEYERRQFERGQEGLNKIISDRERTIDELKQRFNSTGETNSSEINNLQQSLNKFANEKETLSNEYQANIAFLNQQITKLTASNQLKNNQIRQLHQYNALLKKEQFQAIRELQTKWKQERRQRQNQREKQRDLRQRIEEQYRQKEKDWKNRQRELQRDIEKEKRQKSRWSVNNQKLQKQVERLYKQNNQLQQKCKYQESKNQKTVIGGGGAKRELTNELQRQKADFQAIKRMQIDQVKKKYELELTRLNNITQRLQNDLAAKRIDYDNLEDQFKKVSSQYKNMEKVSKQKLSDYNKKMSTLNSQILLTQNLYQSLIGAKSKVVKKEAL